MPKVTFLNELVTVEAKPGQRLLDVAEQSGINVFRGIFQGFHCGGNQGWCNRCKVWVNPLSDGAVNPKTRKERRKLVLGGGLPDHGSARLACQVELTGDVEVRTRAGFVRTQSLRWEADPRPSKWRERWEKRGGAGAADDADDAATEDTAAAAGGKEGA